MEQKITNANDVDIIGKTIVIFSALNLVYVSLHIITIVLAQYGMIAFSKKNILIIIVLTILDFGYWKKLKKNGDKKLATTSLVFGILSFVILCFYIFMLVIAYLYPALD